MAKRPLEFVSTTRSKLPKHVPSPLSPSKISETDQHATITGVVASLSPVKPSRYFDGELTDGETVIRLVGFDKTKRQELQSFCESNIPVTLTDCLIQKNKFKSCLEVVLKSHTKIEPSTSEFNVTDLRTVGSSTILLNQMHEFSDYQRVTVRVKVVKVHEPHKLNIGKTKQDIVVADSTGKATVTLWEGDVGQLQENKSYKLNKLEVRSYQGKQYLSFPSTASQDDISDIEDSIDIFTSEEDDDDLIEEVTVCGIKALTTVYVCINCNRSIQPVNEHMADCSACNTIQRLSSPKQTAKLLVVSGSTRISLRAYDKALREITDTQTSQKEISAQDLLYASQFDCTYNKYNIITNVSRN